jgi:hypothetical protein
MTGLIRLMLPSHRQPAVQPTTLQAVVTLRTYRYSTHGFSLSAARGRIKEEAITTPN